MSEEQTIDTQLAIVEGALEDDFDEFLDNEDNNSQLSKDLDSKEYRIRKNKTFIRKVDSKLKKKVDDIGEDLPIRDLISLRESLTKETAVLEGDMVATGGPTVIPANIVIQVVNN